MSVRLSGDFLRIAISQEPELVIDNPRRIIFFDLDGTLHQQDMFGRFLRYLLCRFPLNGLLVLVLLPLVIGALLLQGRATRWPMSLLLWGATFGHSEAYLKQVEQGFVRKFRLYVTAFPKVQQRLLDYLTCPNTDVWLITGSPQHLVEQVYCDSPWLKKVNIIGSQIAYARGGWVLTRRCLGHEKVVQLEKRIGAPLRLFSGYSDSNQDNPLLCFCQHRWKVTSKGELQQLM